MPFLPFYRAHCEDAAYMQLYTIFLHVELQVSVLMMQIVDTL